MLIVNLGGKGEDIIAVAVPFGTTIRTGFEGMFRPGHVVVQALAHQSGLREACADVVVGQSFPIQMDTTQDRTPIGVLADEIFRICRSGGEVHFHCSSCNREAIADALRRFGLTDVYVDPHLYARGRKP